jgi:thiamine-phosphate pyrophosphorylase
VVDFRLYAISDRRLQDPIDFVSRAAAAGLRAFQLREKDLPTRETLSLARKIKESSTCKLFINDRADIGVNSEADGVHVPETSWPVFRLRQIFPKLLYGASIHSIDIARKAEDEGADFILFGPIFETPHKDAQGLSALQEITRHVNIPVFAVGGMTPERAKQCREAGAWGVAVIRNLLTAPNISERLGEYQESLGSL